MLTSYSEAQGRYDKALLELFKRPRSEVAMALARMHARLLQCQVDAEDATVLRDHVLVPALASAAKLGREGNGTMLEDLLGLLALTPDPSMGDDADAKAARAAWTDALAAARNANEDLYDRAFTRAPRVGAGHAQEAAGQAGQGRCSAPPKKSSSRTSRSTTSKAVDGYPVPVREMQHIQLTASDALIVCAEPG